MSTAQPQLICLCAEWCGTCRDWRPMFDAIARQHPELAVHWVDVEDDAHLLEDSPLDVETFPTMLIANASGEVAFCGPVKPFVAEVERLLRASLQAPGDIATEARRDRSNLRDLLPHWPSAH
jgi:thioredoxin 1